MTAAAASMPKTARLNGTGTIDDEVALLGDGPRRGRVGRRRDLAARVEDQPGRRRRRRSACRSAGRRDPARRSPLGVDARAAVASGSSGCGWAYQRNPIDADREQDDQRRRRWPRGRGGASRPVVRRGRRGSGGVSGDGHAPVRRRSGRPRRRRRRPTRGCGRPAGRAGLRRRGRSLARRVGVVDHARDRRARRSASGRPAARSSTIAGGIRSAAIARSAVEVGEREQHRPAGFAVPGRPQQGRAIGAVRLDERGDGLGPDPGHPRRPEQGRRRGRWTSAAASSMPRAIWPTGPASAGAGPVDRLAAEQRGRDRAVRVGRDDDDRQRAAGPGEVGEAADAGLPGVSASAPSAVADRMTAATVMPGA